jgi:hypothetical protein
LAIHPVRGVEIRAEELNSDWRVKNVLDHVLAPGLGAIATALHSGKVIAASIFFHFGGTAILKDGASAKSYIS